MPRVNSEDAAWVTIETPLNSLELRRFLDDIERLFRINSLLSFDEWKRTGSDTYFFSVRNLSNGKTLKSGIRVKGTNKTVTVRYSDGLKSATVFCVDSRRDGTAKLTITDDYAGASDAERAARIDEVDRSLVQWGRDIHLYLRRWKRWSRIPPWRWYMRSVWQPMTPMGRRIVFLLIVITLAEFILFLFVFTVFWLELDKFLD